MKINIFAREIEFTVSVQSNHPLDRILKEMKHRIPVEDAGNKIVAIKVLRSISGFHPDWFKALGYTLVESPYTQDLGFKYLGLVDSKNFVEKHMNFPIHVSYIKDVK